MQQQASNYLSYNNGRKCLKCEKPISDHAHANIKFCEKHTLPDGSIKSCKDDYHAEKNRLSNLPYQELCNFQKRTTTNIALLEKQKGNTVTDEDLDQYGIYLNRTVKTELSENQQNVFLFIDFSFSQLNDTQFKITRHDNNF